MSSLHANEAYRAVEGILNEHRIPFRVEHGGKHTKVVFEANGKVHRYPICGKSVGRAIANSRADIYRLIKAEPKGQDLFDAAKAAPAPRPPVSIKRIAFHGNELLTFEADGQKWVVMKPVVEAMGIALAPQREKLTSDAETWKVARYRLPSAGGPQEMLCIPLRLYPTWLARLNPVKITDPQVRAKVELYQAASAEALHQFWTTGKATFESVVEEIATQPEVMAAVMVAAPSSPAVSGPVIDQQGNPQPQGNGDIDALLDLMGTIQGDIQALGNRGGGTKLIEALKAEIDTRDLALRDHFDAKIDMLRRAIFAGRDRVPVSTSPLGDEIDFFDVIQEHRQTDRIPARARLLGHVTDRLNKHCASQAPKILHGGYVAQGKFYPTWPRAVVRDWLKASGAQFIEDHFGREERRVAIKAGTLQTIRGRERAHG